MEEVYTLERGEGPVLVSVPHASTYVPDAILARFSAAAACLPDTDWYVDRLYDFVPDLGAGMLVATHSRFVVDLNRPPDDSALYTRRTTGLVPLETFDGKPVYRRGEEPDRAETALRVEKYWHPYHEALAAELGRIREIHGHALVLDAHSIRSRLPQLFDGRLPDFNLGSYGGCSAAPGLVSAALTELESDRRWTCILDGRFRGGFITRHYGRPDRAMHALQLEMAQRAYMQEWPPRAGPHSMRPVREMLKRLIRALSAWRPVP